MIRTEAELDAFLAELRAEVEAPPRRRQDGDPLVPPLPPDLRKELEQAVVRARDTAEAGAANALAVWASARAERRPACRPEQRALRVALRAQARSLGGGSRRSGSTGCARRSPTAPGTGCCSPGSSPRTTCSSIPARAPPVSMDDVAELAARGRASPTRGSSPPATPRRCCPASSGTDDPTTRVAFAPEDRLRLEAILRGLPAALFTADDALGWVYQFWQSKRKNEVNKPGDKIGGADLPPVTQLFTEHYMVRFLLENSLGAWWAGRHPDSPLLREWEYLRFRDDGTPAAGTFEGWPEPRRRGHGHGPLLRLRALPRRRRRHAPQDADGGGGPHRGRGRARPSSRDNLFGLELDPRCTQIAAFALAFDAWKAAGGYRALPVPNIACSGIAVKGQLDDWRRLAGGDDNMAAALDAPLRPVPGRPRARLASSTPGPPPARASGRSTPTGSSPSSTRPSRKETAATQPPPSSAPPPQGTAKAARLLAGRYWLVATNPPFLGIGSTQRALAAALRRQRIRQTRETTWRRASCCSARTPAHRRRSCVRYSRRHWLFLGAYRGAAAVAPGRRAICGSSRGSAPAHSTRSAARSSTSSPGHREAGCRASELDRCRTSTHVPRAPRAKAAALRARSSHGRSPAGAGAAIRMPRIVLRRRVHELLLRDAASQLVRGSDGRRSPRSAAASGRCRDYDAMEPSARTVGRRRSRYGGREHVLLLGGRTRRSTGGRALALSDRARLAWQSAWGRSGVAVSRDGRLACDAVSRATLFDNNAAVVVSRNDRVDLSRHLGVLRRRREFDAAVRRIDPKLERHERDPRQGSLRPRALDARSPPSSTRTACPSPTRDDPTQWLFKGNVVGSEAPLQVAVARLLGYRWPDQEPDALDALADPDGIVCLPVGRRRAPGRRAPRALCSPRAYGADWSPRPLEPSCSPRPARQARPSRPGCATTSSPSTPGCSTTGRSSGTSGTAARTASAPCSTTTGSTARRSRS